MCRSLLWPRDKFSIAKVHYHEELLVNSWLLRLFWRKVHRWCLGIPCIDCTLILSQRPFSHVQRLLGASPQGLEQTNDHPLSQWLGPFAPTNQDTCLCTLLRRLKSSNLRTQGLGTATVQQAASASPVSFCSHRLAMEVVQESTQCLLCFAE